MNLTYHAPIAHVLLYRHMHSNNGSSNKKRPSDMGFIALQDHKIGKYYIDKNVKTVLTHCAQVMPHGDTDLGPHWLSQWLVVWQHQAIV